MRISSTNLLTSLREELKLLFFTLNFEAFLSLHFVLYFYLDYVMAFFASCSLCMGVFFVSDWVAVHRLDELH